MKRVILAMICVLVGLSACDKSKPPTPKSVAVPDSHPVKNVQALPSGTIREGGNTMNRAADLANSLEQQKQDRMDEAEAKNK
jgi:hypothetical protein